MRILSCAKINLHLRIGALAADGFHPLVSWMCQIGLADTIEIEAAPAGSALVQLTCNDSSIPTDGRNLIVKAAQLLAGDKALPPVRIALQKRIPAGGGLGGGSSNAAATLLALNDFWRVALGGDQLDALAAQLGSDVAFFLHLPSAICTGRGQHVQPIASPHAGWAVLVFPPFGMPTPAVYKKFDELNSIANLKSANLKLENFSSWPSLSADDLLAKLVNDLEASAFALNADLQKLHAALQTGTGKIIRMSGSGSTLFTLADSRQGAVALRARIAVLAPQCKTVVASLGNSGDQTVL